MEKVYLIVLLIAIVVLAIVIYNKPSNQEQGTEPPVEEEISQNNNNEIDLPMERARERVTKKPFGIKISPDNSPISPERFSGYHTGVDYEIFKGEENTDVQVFAICDGKLLRRETVSGYGGLIIQECELDNQSNTVLYGHIKISSAQQNIGEYISKGDKLALLGKGFSQETDGERKHLHLGIHKGTSIDIHGYVQNASELADWIDFEEYIKKNKKRGLTASKPISQFEKN